MDVQTAFQVIAGACLHQLLANRPLMLDGDPEGLHQMRVATRRLRAALRLFEQVVPTDAEALRAELKWLATSLGAVRDLDVQLESLRHTADGLHPAPEALMPVVAW